MSLNCEIPQKDIPNVFRTVLKLYNLAPGDFPDLEKFRTKLTDLKIAELSSLKPELIEQLDHCLNVEIPALMEVISFITHMPLYNFSQQ